MNREERKSIYRAACTEAVKHFTDLAVASGEAFDYDEGIAAARKAFETTVRDICNKREFLSVREFSDLTFDSWEDYGEYCCEECRKAYLNIKRERSVVQIRRVTAEAVIEPKITELGYPYRMEYQKYRLKVSLRIDYGRHFEFYIRYRDFNNQKIIDSISERTRAVVEYIQMFGPQLRVKDNGGLDGSWSYPADYVEQI